MENNTKDKKPTCHTHEGEELKYLLLETGELFCAKCVADKKAEERSKLVDVKDIEEQSALLLTNINYIK